MSMFVITATPVAATEPEHLTVQWGGCRGDVDTGYVKVGNLFLCADADYVNGNLGKGWNELDLVPQRATLSLGTQAAATTDYDLRVDADSLQAGKPGYDFISQVQINTALSHASCTVS